MTKNNRTTNDARARSLATAAHPGGASRTQGENLELASPSMMGEVGGRRAVARTALALGGLPHSRAPQDEGLSLQPGDASSISPTQTGTELARARGATQRGSGAQVVTRRIVRIDPAGDGAPQSGGESDPSLIRHVQFGMAGMEFAHRCAVSKSSKRVSFHWSSAPLSGTPRKGLSTRKGNVKLTISVLLSSLLFPPGAVRKVGDLRRPVTRPSRDVRADGERRDRRTRIMSIAWNSKNKLFLAHRLKYETAGSGGDRA